MLRNILILLLLVGFATSCITQEQNPPKAKNGVLSLSAESMKYPLPLAGEFDFYWNQLYETVPENAESSGLIKLPGVWSGYQLPDGTFTTPFGFATYRLKLIPKEPIKEKLAIYITHVGTAYRLYIDGKLIASNGVVAKTEDQYKPAFKPTVAPFSVDKPVDIVLQVANFSSQGGGPWSTISIGKENIIRDFVMQQTGLDIFLFGAIGIIALYHFGLYYLGRSDRSTLMFGIVCSIIAIRVLVTGQLFLVQLLPDMPFEFYRRLEYLSFFLAVPTFIHFFALVFHEDFKKYDVYVVWAVCGSISLITLFTNSGFYTKFLMYVQLFTFIVILVTIYRLIIVVRNKRDGSMILFVGALIFAGFVVNDVLHNWGIIRTGFYTPIGLLLFLFSQAVLLSMRLSKAFTNVEVLSQNLLITNKGYSRFVPRDFLVQLGYEDITQVRLGDQVQRDMTILFADIRSFTSLSENMTPEENFKFLNSYLRQMGPIIERHNGFIDKYIGDAIMALFSIVGNNGLDAAIAMIEELSLYNQRRITQGFVPIKIGIGLHTGRIILGTIGFEDRMDGTVISDSVNLASRLEGLTKYYGVNIIISDALLLTLSDQSKYDFRRLDYVVVKGKSKPVLIYEILNGLADTTKQARLKTKDRFENAVDLYIKKEYEQAALQFRNIMNEDPTDSVAELYLQHCQQLGNFNIAAQS